MVLLVRRRRPGSHGALAWIASCALLAVAGFADSARAQQAPLTPPDVLMTSPTGVSMTDTTFSYSAQDLTIGPFKLERSFYGGANRTNHYFGFGWTHNFDMWVDSGVYGGASQTKVVLGLKTHSFAAVATTNPTNDGSPTNGDEGRRVEIKNGGILFTDRDGTEYQFNSTFRGKVTSIKSPDGGLITFTYVSDKPKIIVSNRGYALVFDYDGAGNISAACGFNRTATVVTTSTTCASAVIKTSYAYTGGKLTGATSVTGSLASYAYNGWGGALSCVTDPGTATCRYTIEYKPGTSQVVKQTLADGSVWTFACTCVYAAGGADPYQDDSTGWTDPSGVGKSFFLTDGVLKGYFDESGRRYLTNFNGGVLLFVKAPEGNEWETSINGRGMVVNNTFRPLKPGVTGYSNIVQDVREYPAGSCANRVTCNLPLTVTDANSNQSSFTYDQIHGGVLTETRPANKDNIQAVVRHAYAQRSAWVSNGGGGYSAEPAIWLPSEDRTCKKGATAGNGCLLGASDEVVTTYEYGPNSGPNNLLPRGKAVTADGVTLRVCYAYDAQGNRIAETNARAGLAVCP